MLREQRQQADQAIAVAQAFGGKDFEGFVKALRKPKHERSA